MELTDERIEDIADANGHACVVSYGKPAEREVIWYDGNLTPFARAIESAATAPLLERIAELEQQLSEARKDAQIIRNQALEDAAKKRAQKPRKLPKVGSGALWEEQQFCYERGVKDGAASVRSVIRAMKKEPQ